MPFEFGDVVLVPFPFTDQTASKKRPAVVVSNRAYNTARLDIIVMAITSQRRPNPRLGDAGSRTGKPPGCSSRLSPSRSSRPSNNGSCSDNSGPFAAEDQAALRKAIEEIIA
jgi:mRNA interferase MazF